MRRLDVSRAAREDLASLVEFLAKDREGYQSVRRFTIEIIGKCRRLANNPALIGSLASEVGVGVRMLPYKSVVIYLRYMPRVLQILRILRSAIAVGFESRINHDGGGLAAAVHAAR